MPASRPMAGLASDSAGNLYGTTTFSAPDSCGNSGCGTVFELERGSDGQWTYRVIHRFKGSDGEAPLGSLVLDSSGNLYGTTYVGGARGYGVVFELSPSGNKWKEHILYSFGAHSVDVAFPQASLIFDASGNLYGTALGGGLHNQGGVFELNRSAQRWKEAVIYSFNGTDGEEPVGDLACDTAGNLYSTTEVGGKFNLGVVFQLTPKSSGKWTETVIHDFTGAKDGNYPGSGVTLDAAGNVYGNAQSGGSDSCGTVFELKPSQDQWTFNVSHSFDGSDGCKPVGGLTLDAAGNIYGTTVLGGRGGYGTAFELSRSGNGWTENVLYSFPAIKDGGYPYGQLILGQEGMIYGTTAIGGVSQNGGYGVVFSITP